MVDDDIGLYISLAGDYMAMTTDLGIDVLQSSSDRSGRRICRSLPLEQSLRFDDSRVQRNLLSQSCDIVGALVVGIGMLQGLSKLSPLAPSI